MDKIICDICGTTYPASATQCPICGYEKPADAVADEEILDTTEAAGIYQPVRGGRFSNANVRKRSKKAAAAVPEDYDTDEETTNDEDEALEPEVRSNKGLVVVLVVLILAILGLVFYLYFNFFAPVAPEDTQSTSTATTAATESVETEAPTIPCTDLQVSDTEILLDAVGNAWLLNALAAPENTTDMITYVSSNESVATVTAEGCVTAVGPGQAVVTVSCGSVVIECNVTVTVTTEPATEATTEPATEATEAPTEETTVPTQDAGDWSLNRKDFTLRIGEAWNLYEGEVDPTLITFKARDTSVATVSKKGIVRGVGVGYTLITAEYNGVKVECTVYVKEAKTNTEETKPAETKPAETEAKPTETAAPASTGSGEEVG